MSSFQSILRDLQHQENISNADFTPDISLEQDADFHLFPTVNPEHVNLLMHRDIHFNGSFSLMLNYYQQEGKGISDDFEIQHIEELMKMEVQGKQNLAPFLYSSYEIEKISIAREAYKKLKAIYEYDNKPNRSHPLLIADLILSEEVYPQLEIQAILREGPSIVSSLISLISSDYFYDPLFPGYGQAPLHAVTCLGKLQEEKSIIPLFEAYEKQDFSLEETVKEALFSIGEPAQKFLIGQIRSQPFNKDNLKAAAILVKFKEEDPVKQACKSILHNPDIHNFTFLKEHVDMILE